MLFEQALEKMRSGAKFRRAEWTVIISVHLNGNPRRFLMTHMVDEEVKGARYDDLTTADILADDWEVVK